MAKKPEEWKLDKWWKRAAYTIGWIGLVLMGFLFWIVAIVLYVNRDKKAKEKKNTLTQAYQKFVYVIGLIWAVLFVLSLVVAVFAWIPFMM